MKKLLNFFKAPITKTFIFGLLWIVPAAFTLKVASKYLAFMHQYGGVIDLIPADKKGEFVMRTFGQTVSSSQWIGLILGSIFAYLIYKGYIFDRQ